jgi:hypothetical protein
MTSESVPLQRPVRAAGLTFLGMVVLVAVFAPLVPGVEPVEFFLTGVAYGLALSVFAVGLILAGSRARARWILVGAGVKAVLVGSGVWLWAAGPVYSDAFFRAVPWALRGLLAALTVYLGAGAVIAGSGWVRFFRPSHRRT